MMKRQEKNERSSDRGRICPYNKNHPDIKVKFRIAEIIGKWFDI